MGSADRNDPQGQRPGDLEAEDRAERGGRARRRAKRAARKARRRAMPWYRRLVPTWRIALGTLLGIVLLGVAGFTFGYLNATVPSANALAAAQSNVYYYSDGKTEIGQTGEVNRISVPIDQISLQMQHAAVSAEDRSFYTNRGVSITGTLRAAWDTASGKGLQGGSTITQQYVKNYYLTQSQTVTRKAKEFFISLKVDQTQSKSDIMAGYLNTSYFGRNAYGIQAAAEAYFGTSAAKLDVAQSAYLASLLQAPSAYSSPSGQAALQARWNYTMDGMAKLKFIDQATWDKTKFPTPKSNWTTPGLSGQAGYLIDVADQYLTDNKVLTSSQLAGGGWKITTTFDKGDEDALAASVKKVLKANLPDTSTAKDVRAGAASVDPTSGKLLAVYGGPDYATQQYNDATRTDIQVGSTFKAFDLAAGLQDHATTQDGRPITPDTYYDGTSGRPVQGLPNGESYAPPNEDNKDYGQITLRYAMQQSVNAVYAQEAADAGLDNVRKMAIAAGLPADTPQMSASNPSLALGVATPDVIDVAGAYGTIANHGVHEDTWSVQSLSRQGENKSLPKHDSDQAMSRDTADQVTSVLQGVISQNGTGYVALGLGRPAAGKTGTTDNNASAWFTGYTPQMVTSVGLFAEDPKTHAHVNLGSAAGINRVNGGSFPAQIWTDYMSQALSGQPVQQFDLQYSGQGQSPAPSTSASDNPGASTSPSPGDTPGGDGGNGGAPSDTASAPSDGSSSPAGNGGSQSASPPGGGDGTDGGDGGNGGTGTGDSSTTGGTGSGTTGGSTTNGGGNGGSSGTGGTGGTGGSNSGGGNGTGGGNGSSSQGSGDNVQPQSLLQ